MTPSCVEGETKMSSDRPTSCNVYSSKANVAKLLIDEGSIHFTLLKSGITAQKFMFKRKKKLTEAEHIARMHAARAK